MMAGVDIGYIVIVLLVILFSMTLHEAIHGYVAYWLGDDTAKLQGRLTLNPVKHIDPFLTVLLPLMLAAVGGPIFGGAKPVPFNPARVKFDEWGAALIAIAGPLTNFIIAFVCFGIWAFMGGGETGIAGVLIISVMVNLGFFIFNILPIPPLDGSRVAYAFAPDFIRSGMEVIERYGIIFVFAIVLLASQYISTIMLTAMGGVLDLFQLIFALK